jgi:predicted TIM-barrel fold metal-dependent hydrolase
MKMKPERREFLKKLISSVLLTSSVSPGRLFAGKSKDDILERFKKIRKIDIHTHISSDASYLREVMDQWNLKMFTICNEGLKSDRLKAQIKAAVEISEKSPRYYAWCTTFDLNGIGQPGWSDKVISTLKEDFDTGALAVKIWKEVGMQLKDTRGNFMQVDDPVFDPIFKFIGEEGKTLFLHIGDPPGYWLSTGADGLPDAWFKKDNGVWNRVGDFKGEVSYDTLMLARDRVLEKYHDLKIVGCHMGNLSFDVDQLAVRLDRYPNYAVETSFTIPLLMEQAREKTRNFFLKYQDRILYGSDISGGLIASPFLVDMSKINEKWTGEELLKLKMDLLQQYEQDFSYLATEGEFVHGNYSVHGLALPEAVLRKIYFDNAVEWVPGITG